MPGSYTDILSTTNGCDSIINTLLTVYPSPINSASYIICEGDYIQIGNTIYDQQGEYTDTLSTIYGCDSILNTSITVSEPEANLTQQGNSLNAVGLNGVTPYMYNIYGPNGLLTTMQSSGSIMQFNPIINGMYYLVVTDALGCISDTSFFNVDFIATSISSFEDIDLIIYPNPSTGLFNINFNTKNIETVEINIYNYLGERVFSDYILNFTGRYERILNLSQYSKGIYLLELKDKNDLLNKKIILK
tara:strand:- start:646 stop:1383 length:738 start_codon:yes stop_codon:yes gene_type:complete